MSEPLNRYRDLERQLWLVRWRNDDNESSEEDALLDRMDQVWEQLSANEQESLRREGPQCWPSDMRSHPRLAYESSQGTPWPYEGFRDANEAIISEDAAR